MFSALNPLLLKSFDIEAEQREKSPQKHAEIYMELSKKIEELKYRIDLTKLPQHIAIIMDGNGRWAQQRGLPRIFGHRAGTESVREIVRACGELGLQALTLFAFSTENWSRPKTEVNSLMRLLCASLRREVPELNKFRVRLSAIGRISELPRQVYQELKSAIKKLEQNEGLHLTLALNYGGRQELLDAVNKILRSGIKAVDETTFRRYLYTNGMRDPDLLIRTSGELRLSNFLLFQTAYTEFVSTPTFWPDFRRKELYEAILEYQSRQRRFGNI